MAAGVRIEGRHFGQRAVSGRLETPRANRGARVGVDWAAWSVGVTALAAGALVEGRPFGRRAASRRRVTSRVGRDEWASIGWAAA
jgi:hypothetical protein